MNDEKYVSYFVNQIDKAFAEQCSSKSLLSNVSYNKSSNNYESNNSAANSENIEEQTYPKKKRMKKIKT